MVAIMHVFTICNYPLWCRMAECPPTKSGRSDCRRCGKSKHVGTINGFCPTTQEWSTGRTRDATKLAPGECWNIVERPVSTGYGVEVSRSGIVPYSQMGAFRKQDLGRLATFLADLRQFLSQRPGHGQFLISGPGIQAAGATSRAVPHPDRPFHPPTHERLAGSAAPQVRQVLAAPAR